jgi:hypothetical protein
MASPYAATGLHEFTALEHAHVVCGQFEPLSAAPFFGEPPVPIAFNPVGIVRADCVDQFQILGEMYRYLPRALLDKVGFAYLVTPLAPDLH